ncbi:Down syndrome cell adhesion molecule-like protein 1-like 2, partial [Homarus americanus]
MSERAGRAMAQAGDRVTLPCVAQGHPPPHYTDGQYRMWTVGGSLDTGQWAWWTPQHTCVANNTAGETRVSTHLLVTLPLSVQVTPWEVQVDAGEAGTALSRLRSGGRVRIRPESLHVAPLDPSDAGIYQCAATYAHDYAHAHAYVTRSCLASSGVSLHRTNAAARHSCIAQVYSNWYPTPHITLTLDGFPSPLPTGESRPPPTPTPHITWTLDGFPIPHSHSSVHVTDGGTYTCSAENSAGSEVHRACLKRVRPPSRAPHGADVSRGGETFIVSCPVSGCYPIHNITWKKDGVRLPTSHRQRVHANGLLLEQVTAQLTTACTLHCLHQAGLTDTQDLSVRRLGAGGAACIVSRRPAHHLHLGEGRRPIEEVEGVTVSTINQFSNTLMINRLTASTPASTPAGPPTTAEATHSADLAVNGTPTPALHLGAAPRAAAPPGAPQLPSGYPSWDAGQGHLASHLGGGAYQCQRGSWRQHSTAWQASQPTVAWRKETEPPWFAVRSQRQQVKVGGTATLSCEARGDAPLALSWTRGTAPLPPLPRPRPSAPPTGTSHLLYYCSRDVVLLLSSVVDLLPPVAGLKEYWQEP